MLWQCPVVVSQLEGVATQFRYADADFFPDVCSYRNDTPTSSSLPQMAKNKLNGYAKRSSKVRPPSKLLSQVRLSSTQLIRAVTSYAEREHTDLLQMLRDARIAGLFFISGGELRRTHCRR